jgi:hypothetical protein
MVPRLLLASLAFSLLSFPIRAQSFSLKGDYAAADKYADLAERHMREGRWSQALIVLERGADYGDASSDIFYLLALARSHFDQPRGAVLESLGRALETDRWHIYSPAEVRLMEAENYISLKRYNEALAALAGAPESPRSALLRLEALRFVPGTGDFYLYLADTLDRYPRDPAPVRIFLRHLKAKDDAGKNPAGSDRQTLDLVIRRLPALLLSGPDLAWMAAPFLRDTEEAGRLVAAYRAVNRVDPASLPVALRLGIIDEETVLEELFGFQDEPVPRLDKALLEEIWDLLRDDARRSFFRRNLSAWSGVITEDSNGDGIAEAAAVYQEGMLSGYSFDADQDRLPELVLDFEAGKLRAAFVPVMPESGEGKPVYPARDEDRRKIAVQWEEYPAVREAELGGERFLPRPQDFFYRPVRFGELPGGDLLFPGMDPAAAGLTRRTLVSYAYRVERPSGEFLGGIETVELNRMIPVRAWEYLEGRLVSETDFNRGRPLAQRADLDLDGRMETVRRFRRGASLPADDPAALLDYARDVEYAESDWDGDGIFESREPFR